jgi:hypothetical protein
VRKQWESEKEQKKKLEEKRDVEVRVYKEFRKLMN